MSALTQIQAFPRRHTRHTCPHDPKDLPSHARTDGISRVPPLSVLLAEAHFLRNGFRQLIRVQHGSDQGLDSSGGPGFAYTLPARPLMKRVIPLRAIKAVTSHGLFGFLITS